MKITPTTVTINGQELPAREIVEGQIRIVVRQRLYRDRITLAALERKLLPAAKPDADRDIDEETARQNFCYFAAQSCIEGVPWQLPSRESNLQEAETLFEAFTFLPDSLVTAWLRQLNLLENPNDDPVTKRSEFLTPEEQQDPNSDASARSSKAK